MAKKSRKSTGARPAPKGRDLRSQRSDMFNAEPSGMHPPLPTQPPFCMPGYPDDLQPPTGRLPSPPPAPRVSKHALSFILERPKSPRFSFSSRAGDVAEASVSTMPQYATPDGPAADEIARRYLPRNPSRRAASPLLPHPPQPVLPPIPPPALPMQRASKRKARAQPSAGPSTSASGSASGSRQHDADDSDDEPVPNPKPPRRSSKRRKRNSDADISGAPSGGSKAKGQKKAPAKSASSAPARQKKNSEKSTSTSTAVVRQKTPSAPPDDGAPAASRRRKKDLLRDLAQRIQYLQLNEAIRDFGAHFIICICGQRIVIDKRDDFYNMSGNKHLEKCWFVHRLACSSKHWAYLVYPHAYRKQLQARRNAAAERAQVYVRAPPSETKCRCAFLGIPKDTRRAKPRSAHRSWREFPIEEKDFRASDVRIFLGDRLVRIRSEDYKHTTLAEYIAELKSADPLREDGSGFSYSPDVMAPYGVVNENKAEEHGEDEASKDCSDTESEGCNDDDWEDCDEQETGCCQGCAESSEPEQCHGIPVFDYYGAEIMGQMAAEQVEDELSEEDEDYDWNRPTPYLDAALAAYKAQKEASTSNTSSDSTNASDASSTSA
ncbi:hypothetical protein HDZ31DRAFT_73753 [Schizophyllum fasciatum]